MLAIRETYIIDAKGKRKQVVLDLRDYVKIQEELEELAEIKAFDRAMVDFNRDDLIPFDKVVSEIKAKNNVL